MTTAFLALLYLAPLFILAGIGLWIADRLERRAYNRERYGTRDWR
jgi:predicted small integral membrane protein